MNGSVFDKLDKLRVSLLSWESAIKRKRSGLKQKLTNHLTDFLDGDHSEDNLVDLIETKVHLNMAIDKDEVF